MSSMKGEPNESLHHPCTFHMIPLVECLLKLFKLFKIQFSLFASFVFFFSILKKHSRVFTRQPQISRVFAQTLANFGLRYYACPFFLD